MCFGKLKKKFTVEVPTLILLHSLSGCRVIHSSLREINSHRENGVGSGSRRKGVVKKEGDVSGIKLINNDKYGPIKLLKD